MMARRDPWLLRNPGIPPLLLAHRGGRGPWRENTVEAFEAGLALGADGIELDVRRCADGTLVVHHDAAVEGLGPLHELGRADLPRWLPTLEEALEACAGAIVNLEIKNSPGDQGFDPGEPISVDLARVLPKAARAVAGTGGGPEGRVRDRNAPGPGRLLVSSFSPTALEVLVARSPVHLIIGLLVAPSFDPYQALSVAAGLGAASLNPFCDQVTPSLVESAHGLGLAVVTWTANSPSQLEAVLACGVDAVISDEVELARSILGPGRADR